MDQLSDQLEENTSYVVYINTPDGVNVRGGNVRLEAVLLRNGKDVTDQFDASCFVWKRSSGDENADTDWNNAHLEGSKSISLSGADVRYNANFECHFQWDNGLTA